MIPDRSRQRRRWRIALVVVLLAVPVYDGIRANVRTPAGGSTPAVCRDC